jgi:alpha-tubulin suppressor-like RCC1 family protein
MGSNDEGVLGLGFNQSLTQLKPVLINGISKIEQIATGRLHSLALDSKGKVFGWGTTKNGAIGI